MTVITLQLGLALTSNATQTRLLRLFVFVPQDSGGQCSCCPRVARSLVRSIQRTPHDWLTDKGRLELNRTLGESDEGDLNDRHGISLS
jgi:hypothetical protein